ncbi:type III-A CRISPR-associated RAMP protein Csm3 [Chondromyces apiculatus]|uniref:CRISPR system Cms endoribonuclease Csm3 n=1 Tax=Chondromyces apiculatus DSM 436 TaxID=1192034 RepID=A0A017T4L3_9BACT|nr:type III-A CRISPR-associated RAMP protein Csm3 [Chondromyces apiculatus]EYF04198.1 CRISPR-associated RAMP Csm3 [Chondromyces apiculatus DSM 436]
MTWGMLEKVFVRGTITTLTGLRVGGSEQGLDAAALENLVARHALLDEPYIPGSSLRGKMRCLLERLQGIAGPPVDGVGFGPADDPVHPLVQLFGMMSKDGAGMPSRVMVRDALLTAESRKRLGRLRGVLPMTETKAEALIDRVTAAATARTVERLPAGAELRFELVLDVRALPERQVAVASDVVVTEGATAGDPTVTTSAVPAPALPAAWLLEVQRASRNEENGWGRDEDLRWLLTGLDLIQDDVIGGHGSRGYGRVKIRVDGVTHRTRDDYLQGRPERALEGLAGDLSGRVQSINERGERERQEILASLPAIEAGR